jgi:hypothetical protein
LGRHLARVLLLQERKQLLLPERHLQAQAIVERRQLRSSVARRRRPALARAARAANRDSLLAAVARGTVSEVGEEP